MAMERKLTTRQQRFVNELANPKNKSQAEAARKAGYSKKTAKQIASENLTKPYLSSAFAERRARAIANHEVTPEEVLGSAVFQMRTTIEDLLDDNGSFDYNKARGNGSISAVKKLEIEETRQIATGDIVRKTKVELNSNQDARKEVANYIGLEKFENKKPLTDKELFQELVNRMITNHNYTLEEAIFGVKRLKQFADIDESKMFEK